MCMIRTLLENRRFFVELGGERGRCRSQRNCLPQGSVLAPLLFNVCTDDQSIHPGTRRFVYADDLAVTTQSMDFAPIEETLTSALGGLSEYYTTESRNKKQHNPQTKNLKMGSHSNHTQDICSSAMLLSCRVCLPGVGTLHPRKETGRDTE